MKIKKESALIDDRSRYIRRLVVDALIGGDRGHVGSSMSLIEILRVLYDHVMRYRPAEPRWPGRDRCILSKGHGCLALYALLADKGFFPKEELATFCRKGSRLGGHPGYGLPGVEAATGALGHGLAIGVGMALAARAQGRDSQVFVVMGDGELGEGSVWEAAMAASKHRLGNLTAIIDYNKIQSAGFVKDILPLEPLADKWRAFGFEVQEVDGHNIRALNNALPTIRILRPFSPPPPRVVICHTVKGKGLSFAENDPTWHHKNSFDAELRDRMYAVLA